MRYANIVNGVVNIIEVEPEKVNELEKSGLVLIDIRNVNPKPKKGWLYDGEIFSEPEKIKKDKKSRSKKEFFSQLSDLEIRNIQDKAKMEDDINAWLFRLSFDNDIDYQESLDFLVSKSIINQEKTDNMK